jgi:hypothetical protein
MGSEPPRCGEAIFGRAVGTGPQTTTNSRMCAPATGTAAVGTSSRDRLMIPGRGEIADLASNVTEWVSDD